MGGLPCSSTGFKYDAGPNRVIWFSPPRFGVLGSELAMDSTVAVYALMVPETGGMLTSSGLRVSYPDPNSYFQ